MSTPSDLQRLASVVRTAFPAPIAIPFFASTEPGGDAELPGLLSSIIRYLALIHLRAYLGGEGVESAALEERLAEAHRPGLPLIVGSGEARGVPYVVLEPVRGEPVGKLPPREAACAVADLGRALGALHARGVLHGGVKTALARRDGERTSFADFGWRAADSAGEETFEESRRAEVRALGAVLHEVLTGSPRGERALDPRRKEPGTPGDLAAISRKALHPEGYRTAGEKVERMTAAISLVEGPILLHHFDGRAPRRLAEGFFPQWSGDGTRIYFLRNLPNADGVELRSVSLETEEEKLHTKLRPMWMVASFVDISPRDEVVWVEREEGNRELWLMDLDA